MQYNVTLTNATCYPDLLPTEYMKISFLFVMIAVGAPVNTYAFYKFLHLKRVTKALSTSMFMNLNLNVTDLLILYVYALSEAVWYLTFAWYGGWMICRIMKFLHSLAFQACSNVVACISIERLICFVEHQSPGTFLPGQTVSKRRRVRSMMFAAWTLAALESSPQMFFWTTYSLSCGGTSYEQCVSIFDAWHHQNVPLSQGWRQLEVAYGFVHLALVFWIPLIVTGSSYVLLLFLLQRERFHGSDSLHSVNGSSCKYTSSFQGNERKPSGTQSCSSLRQPGLTIRDATRKTQRVAMFVVGVYIVCWLPYNIVELLKYFVSLDVYLYLDFPTGFIVLNSVVNPFLYYYPRQTSTESNLLIGSKYLRRIQNFLGLTSRRSSDKCQEAAAREMIKYN